MSAIDRALSVRELSHRLGIGVHATLTLIDAGEIEAIDVRLPGASRPRYRIPADAIARFIAAKSTRPTPRATRKRREGRPVYRQWI